MLQTRISNSFCLVPPKSSSSGMLIKIYPMQMIDKPIQLGHSISVIGRDETCDVIVDADSVSRRHALFECRHGVYYLCDNESTNGTFVNEHRICSTELQSGDRIRFGNQIFKFLTDDSIESKYHEVVFKMMTTDGLTQVYNKRFFLEAVERQLQQSQRGNQSLCLLLMDLDKFKSVNDTYGHLAGDAVLAEFAHRASSVLRGGELMARIGGEEFAILCAPATLDQATIAANRVLTITAANPVPFESISVPMTVSIGIAAYPGSGDIDPNSLIADADAMLYRAKENGRNQIQFAR